MSEDRTCWARHADVAALTLTANESESLAAAIEVDFGGGHPEWRAELLETWRSIRAAESFVDRFGPDVDALDDDEREDAAELMVGTLIGETSRRHAELIDGLDLDLINEAFDNLCEIVLPEGADVLQFATARADASRWVVKNASRRQSDKNYVRSLRICAEMSFIFRERVFGLSCRQLAACLDSIGWRAAADILKRLERDGLLTCVKRGRYFPGTVSKASMWMFNHEGVE